MAFSPYFLVHCVYFFSIQPVRSNMSNQTKRDWCNLIERVRSGAKRWKQDGGIFENGRKGQKNVLKCTFSENLRVIFSQNWRKFKDIFSQNRRKLWPNFPKQEGGTLLQPPRSRRAWKEWLLEGFYSIQEFKEFPVPSTAKNRFITSRIAKMKVRIFFSVEINTLMVYDFYALILLFVLSYLYNKKKTEPIIKKTNE
jgi:hypothetical protein